MTERDTFPAGVPCWIDNNQADPEAAQRFYAALFGWEFAGYREYAIARLRGRDVAGIARRPHPGLPQAWLTSVRVDDADAVASVVAETGGAVIAEPFDAGPAGRMAVIADPAGAQLCLLQPQADRVGAQIVNEPNAWANVALQSPDPDAASRFYETVFGWVSEPWGPTTLFRLPGYVGGEPGQPVPRDFVALMTPAAAAANWSVDFWVEDADRTADLAARLGGAVLEAPADRPPTPLRSAVLADPGGAPFSVSAFVG